jgi:D-glycero-beta-D-manno-heptose-7-phosphate kinase
MNSFKDKKILVLGDVILDRYLNGNVTRISPEAPVPVVDIKDEKYVPGGAANTANNIVSLGGIAHVISVVGNDTSGSLLLQEMEKVGIDTSGVLRDSSRPTIEKTRVLGQMNQMVRLDYEKIDPLDEEIENSVLKNIERAVPLVDSVVISDYGKGMISAKIVDFLRDICEKTSKKFIVDPKPRNKDFYRNAYLITPNEKEAKEMSGEEDIENMGEVLSRKFNSNILITRGERGMFLYEKNGRKINIPTEARDVFDVSGAGDTVAAVLSLGVASGMEIKDVAAIANTAAGIVVGKRGTSTVTIEELSGSVKTKIVGPLHESVKVLSDFIENGTEDMEKLTELMVDAYRNGKKILVFGNGGSASDAQHFVGELVGRFKIERKGLPAIALNADTTILTAIGNDFGYDSIFERQVEAFGEEGDIVIGISTSGNSPNVVKALEKAKAIGLKTVCLTGKGGKVVDTSDVAIKVPSDNTPRIQEAHTVIIHTVCEMMEKELYESTGNSQGIETGHN